MPGIKPDQPVPDSVYCLSNTLLYEFCKPQVTHTLKKNWSILQKPKSVIFILSQCATEDQSKDSLLKTGALHAAQPGLSHSLHFLEVQGVLKESVLTDR